MHWGSSGKHELQAMVAQWFLHIKLGKLAAKVLCEYLDSRIHAFDNTQKMHPNVKPKSEGVDRGKLTGLAKWQDKRLKSVLEKYAAFDIFNWILCSFGVAMSRTSLQKWMLTK